MLDKTKKNLLFCTNCQGPAITKYLQDSKKFNELYNVDYIENWILLKTNDKSKYIEKLKICDVFIYQPLKKKHGELSTETENGLKTYLKSGCKLISFPYIYNSGLWPFFHHVSDENEFYPGLSGFRITNIEVIKELLKSYSKEQILKLYIDDKINFNYKKRFFDSISILEENEKNTDIPVSKYILDNYQSKRLFFIKDHPSKYILIYVANKILEILNIEYIIEEGKFYENYHQMIDSAYKRKENYWPITESCAKELNLEYVDNDGKIFFLYILRYFILS
jgi:hypothetical protein